MYVQTHGCEAWSRILIEEQSLRVYVGKVLRRDEVTKEWKYLCTEGKGIQNVVGKLRGIKGITWETYRIILR